MIKIILEPVSPQQRDTLFRMLQYSLFEESLTDLNEMNGEALFEYPWFDLYFTEEDREACYGNPQIPGQGDRKEGGYGML